MSCKDKIIIFHLLSNLSLRKVMIENKSIDGTQESFRMSHIDT